MGVLKACICVEIGSDTRNAKMLMFALGPWRCPARQFDVRLATERNYGTPDLGLSCRVHKAMCAATASSWLQGKRRLKSFGLVLHSAETLKVQWI